MVVTRQLKDVMCGQQFRRRLHGVILRSIVARQLSLVVIATRRDYFFNTLNCWRAGSICPVEQSGIRFFRLFRNFERSVVAMFTHCV